MYLPSTVCVAGCSVAVFNRLKTVGVKLKSALTFVNHANDIVRTCNFHTWTLRRNRCFLSPDVAIASSAV